MLSRKAEKSGLLKISAASQKTDFMRKLAAVSGEDLNTCMQCGMCTGACPLAHRMDRGPREIMRWAQLGRAEKLQGLNAPRVCSTCDTCCVVCPRGIDVPRVMEALRLMVLRKDFSWLDANDIPGQTLREFPQIAMVAAFRKLAS